MQAQASKNQTRHDQLFELIRQKHQADTTVAKVRGHVIRKITAADFEQLKAAAARSLQASR